MKYFTYKCIECDEEFEIRAKITELPKTICPECKGRLYRTIGMTHFITKPPRKDPPHPINPRILR